jgi:predicted N-acyltransferase
MVNCCVFGERKKVRWSLGSSELSYTVTDKFIDVPAETWDSLNHEKNVFLSSEYLSALAKCWEGNLFYILFFKNEAPIGIAVLQYTYFVSGELKSHVDVEGGAGFVARVFGRQSRQYPLIVCGSPFCTGPHGYIFQKEIQVEEATTALCYALTDVIHHLRKDKRDTQAVIVKDFYPKDYNALNELKECGFHTFAVDHLLKMPLDANWKNFEDYLNALNTKFRTKAKAALKKFEGVETRIWEASDLLENATLVQALYRNVYDRAEFAMEPLTVDFLVELKNALKEKMLIQAYYVSNEIIGYQIALINHKELEAFLVGIDYEANAAYGLYSNMLLSFVKSAIDEQCEEIAFGRTAGEIKSTFGAVPIEMRIALRHPGRLRNALLKLFFTKVHPGNEPQRSPFKQEWQTVLETKQREWNSQHNG